MKSWDTRLLSIDSIQIASVLYPFVPDQNLARIVQIQPAEEWLADLISDQTLDLDWIFPDFLNGRCQVLVLLLRSLEQRTHSEKKGESSSPVSGTLSS